MALERIVFGLASLMCFSAVSWGDDTQNFFVAAISTELHRATLSSGADTYAVVNCNPLVGDGEPDLSTLDEDGFIAELTDVTHRCRQSTAQADQRTVERAFRLGWLPKDDRI